MIRFTQEQNLIQIYNKLFTYFRTDEGPALYAVDVQLTMRTPARLDPTQTFVPIPHFWRFDKRYKVYPFATITGYLESDVHIPQKQRL